MLADEYRKLAEVEDRMWYFRALHGHVERALDVGLAAGAGAVLDAGCGTGGLIRRLAPRHTAWRGVGGGVEPLAWGFARERGDGGARDPGGRGVKKWARGGFSRCAAPAWERAAAPACHRAPQTATPAGL